MQIPPPGVHAGPRIQSPRSTELVTSARTVARPDNGGWSLYGAPWLQPVALTGLHPRQFSSWNMGMYEMPTIAPSGDCSLATV
jgi:hypothetical protein